MNIEKKEPHSPEYTFDQIQLIKATVAKNATDDELRLFLYRAKILGLDPLKPGQIHFIKYGNNAGTIVVGIDGFRSRAASTGKHSGTKRGVIRDAKGVCIGAWAEVYRSDWSQPARDEVSLKEYSTGRNNWQRMPETMIKKVAECAVLRMAFPDELSGVYAPEELDQAEEKTKDDKKPETSSTPNPPLASPKPNPLPITPAATPQAIEEMFQLAEDRGYSHDYVRNLIKKAYPKATGLNAERLAEVMEAIHYLPNRAVPPENPVKNESSEVPF